MFKISEQVVAHRLLQLTEGNNIFDKFQSVNRQNNSTETVLWKITVILTRSDEGEHLILDLINYLQPLIVLLMLLLSNR